jgi:TonB-linked SusC/RagA family outer membrane protein
MIKFFISTMWEKNPAYKTYLRAMKLSVILCFLGMMQVSASVFSQNSKISFSYKEMSIKEVFNDIEKNTEFRFFYNEDYIDLDRKVTMDGTDRNVEEVLTNLLESSDADFKVLENNLVVIAPRELIQQKAVTGKTTDSKTGAPLPGVNVVVKGTSTGAFTDTNGNYSITLPETNGTLVFSFVGYQSQEIAVSAGSIIDVVLTEESLILDEVVVIGYGTVKKKDLTGSVASIQTKDLANSVVANVGQMIQGKAAGVEITSTSGGTPGAGMDIKIRGTTTLNATGPLTIIDGMPGDVDMVTPSEIESIDILKDASSAAIYGSRGANGVIIITTKKGKIGAPKVTYDSYYGISIPGKKLDVLNASDYIDLVFNIQGGTYDKATGHWINPGDLPVIFNDETHVRSDSVDMQDEIFRTARVQSQNINVSGGTDIAKYRFSAGYFDQGSTRGNYNYTRYNFKSSTEFKIGKHLVVGNNTMFRSTKTTGRDADIGGALRWAPYQGVFSNASTNPGRYSFITNAGNLNDAVNPMTPLAYNKDNGYDNKLLTQLYGEVTIIQGLTFHSQFQYEYDTYRYLNYLEKDYINNVSNANYLDEGYSVGMWPKFENYLTFTKTIGAHALTVMGGISYEKGSNGRSISVKGTGYGGLSIPIKKVTLGSNPATVNGAGVWMSPGMSYFGRLNYSLMDRYLLTANFRADASYKFAPANRWGYFPSVSAAWKIKEEAFLKDINLISTMKLRVSWGKAGNDQINEFAYVSNVYTGGYSGGENLIIYPFGIDNALTSTAFGATVNTLPSSLIRWEETTTMGLGIDAGFFNDRLGLTIDYYNKITNGILVPVPVPLSTGINNPTIKNAASVTNKGIDMQLSYRGSTGFGLDYNTTLVAGYNKNNVKSLGEGQPIYANNNQEVGYVNRTEAGKPIGYYYGYKTDGILYTQTEADAYNEKYGTTSAAGDYKFLDVNGDGKISDADRTNLGNAMPAWTYGINLFFSYKGFDLQIAGSGVYGCELVNYNRAYWLEGGVRPFNGSATLLTRWRYDGDTEAKLPRVAKTDPNKNTRFSNRYVEDASYARLKTLTLGYTFNNKLFGNVLQSLRIYTTIENALLITKYTGYDPEVGGGTIGRGIDSQGIPMPRNFLFGVQLSF